jgi:hypothetical protein
MGFVTSYLDSVMPGLEPGIQRPQALYLSPWIAGSGPAMTSKLGKPLSIAPKGTTWRA